MGHIVSTPQDGPFPGIPRPDQGILCFLHLIFCNQLFSGFSGLTTEEEEEQQAHGISKNCFMTTLVLDCTLSVESWITGLSAAYNNVAVHHEKGTLAAGVAIKAAPMRRQNMVSIFSAEGISGLLINIELSKFMTMCDFSCILRINDCSFHEHQPQHIQPQCISTKPRYIG